jgi:hypothetical protein
MFYVCAARVYVLCVCSTVSPLCVGVRMCHLAGFTSSFRCVQHSQSSLCGGAYVSFSWI